MARFNSMKMMMMKNTDFFVHILSTNEGVSEFFFFLNIFGLLVQ